MYSISHNCLEQLVYEHRSLNILIFFSPFTQLNNVHAIHEHPAEVHVAHAQKNVMEVEFKDASDVREISLGGVKKAEAQI